MLQKIMCRRIISKHTVVMRSQGDARKPHWPPSRDHYAHYYAVYTYMWDVKLGDLSQCVRAKQASVGSDRDRPSQIEETRVPHCFE